ncbi:hypothetical protein EMWEY_00022210 [Eimeria maxima]|uniref:Uncharacterized protein n=1 Tax=Eimeria maxima TaxID=5804 RepID=U6M5Y8_EIMMA|nr:hypothetical protein EMWEY_00022210 [Eimeria maxima]CDJ59451.1 hypothetical protein EMWEY_00022210 [Eimeria maxima]
MSIPHVGQYTWTRLPSPTQHTRHARSRPRNLSLLACLAASLSIAVILISFSICKYLRSRGRGSGIIHRNLAAEGGDGIDEEVLSIIEGCLDLEADMGVMQERAISSSTSDSSHRVTELVSMLSEAAAAKESVEGRLPVGGEVDSSEQWLEEQSDFEDEDNDMGCVPTPSKGAFVERSGFTGVAPALDPDSWMDTIPSISIQPQESENLLWVKHDNRDPNHALKSAISNRERPESLRDLLDPGDIRDHPYVRLPVLEEGVRPRRLRVSVLFAQQPRKSSPHVYLQALRSLFEKKTLNQRDVDILLNAVERLVVTSWLQSQKPPKQSRPRFLVEVLGDHFLALDAIVCAIELVGEHMQLSLWWEKFTASFNTNLSLPAPWSSGSTLVKFHRQLARRLIAALDIYKQGRRPPPGEVVALKKLLFCHPPSRLHFRDPKWDPWRHDGECS